MRSLHAVCRGARLTDRRRGAEGQPFGVRAGGRRPARRWPGRSRRRARHGRHRGPSGAAATIRRYGPATATSATSERLPRRILAGTVRGGGLVGGVVMDEQKMLAEAEAALGNGDRLIAIGVVQPRGSGLAMLAGGSFGAGAAGFVGGPLGARSGHRGRRRWRHRRARGQQVDAESAGHTGETGYMFIAASEQRLYLFQGHAGVTVTLGRCCHVRARRRGHRGPLPPAAPDPRVEVLHSGDRWVFEAPRGRCSATRHCSPSCTRAEPRRRGGLGQEPAVRG